MCAPSTRRMDEEDGAILDEEHAKDESTEEGLAKEESAENDPAEDGLTGDGQ